MISTGKRISIYIILLSLLFTGCTAMPRVEEPDNSLEIPAQNEITAVPSLTPFQPAEELNTADSAQSTEVIEETDQVWLSPSLPKGLSQLIEISDDVKRSDHESEANLLIEPVEEDYGHIDWLYVLVAPFPTLVDSITEDKLMKVWHGETLDSFSGSSLYVSGETKAAFEEIWGAASTPGIKEIESTDFLDFCWSHQPSWAIIPFDELEPRWKVLKIDGNSPLEKDFVLEDYPLLMHFGITGNETLISQVNQEKSVVLPHTNYDPGKMTRVLITGVTALVRATGAKMEEHGMEYPALNIRNWMLDADITHVSNEVSFSPDCPAADPYQSGLRFCSRPEYYALLEYAGVDVVELSGNHLLDWSQEAFEYTLSLYRAKGMYYYAGGENTDEARKPFLVEHNGNKIAILGCNPAGPEKVWATETTPGAANCEDYEWIKSEIASLRADGYLPIVTLQYNEHYAITPTDFQKRDFPPLIDAGAVIVSGSQAHYPNGMEFRDENLIHYGLGNLFFDQMDFLFPGVQREFLDLHVFYDGRYINTVILTAELEDYSQPRPMTDEERSAFLKEAFDASIW